MKKKLVVVSMATAVALSITACSSTSEYQVTEDKLENTIHKVSDELSVATKDMPDLTGSIKQVFDTDFTISSVNVVDTDVDLNMEYVDDGSSIQGQLTVTGDAIDAFGLRMIVGEDEDSLVCDFYFDNDTLAFDIPILPNGMYIDLNSSPEYEMLKYDNMSKSLEMFSNMENFMLNKEALNDVLYDYLSMFQEYMEKGEMEEGNGYHVYTIDNNIMKEYLTALSEKVANDENIKNIFMTYENVMSYYALSTGDTEFSYEDTMDSLSNAILETANNIEVGFRMVEEYTLSGDYVDSVRFKMCPNGEDSCYEFGYNSEMTNGNILEDLNSYFNYENADTSIDSYYLNANSSLVNTGDNYSQMVDVDLTAENSTGEETWLQMDSSYEGTANEGQGNFELYLYDDMPIYDLKIASEEDYNRLMPLYTEYINMDYSEENMPRLAEIQSEEGFYENANMLYSTNYEEYVEYIEEMNASDYNLIDMESFAPDLPADTAMYVNTGFVMANKDNSIHVELVDFDAFVESLSTRVQNGSLVSTTEDAGKTENEIDMSTYTDANTMFGY